MEYYLAITKDEALLHAPTRKDFQNTILSERRQQATYCMIPCIENVPNRQIHENRKKINGCPGLGQGAVGGEADRGIGNDSMGWGSFLRALTTF